MEPAELVAGPVAEMSARFARRTLIADDELRALAGKASGRHHTVPVP